MYFSRGFYDANGVGIIRPYPFYNIATGKNCHLQFLFLRIVRWVDLLWGDCDSVGSVDSFIFILFRVIVFCAFFKSVFLM